MEEPNEQINTIKQMNAKELCRFPANELWSKYKEHSENTKKARTDREVALALQKERDRIESVIRSRVVS
jgi:hypothetical protein